MKKQGTGDRQNEVLSKYSRQIEANALELVQPHLLPIYDETTGSRAMVRQIGTGSLLAHRGRAVLITAKHALYGHEGEENPLEKAVFVAGSLKMIGHLSSSEIVPAKDHDLVALYSKDFSPEQCLQSSHLCAVQAPPRVVTIQGFLARDFNRSLSKGMLSPAPYIYSNSLKECGSGYVGILYPKSRNRDTDSGHKVMAPIPRGISGGPMLDAARLTIGRISIIGVFTDYCRERGIAFGESSSKVLGLLAGV